MLGSAPLDWSSFRAALLGQLGETRLQGAIDADIAGQNNHAQALDADTSGPLRDIHRRVATAILFESSGGQTDKSAQIGRARLDIDREQVVIDRRTGMSLTQVAKRHNISKASVCRLMKEANGNSHAAVLVGDGGVGQQAHV